MKAGRADRAHAAAALAMPMVKLCLLAQYLWTAEGCFDIDYGALDKDDTGCSWYRQNSEQCADYDDADFNSAVMCCGCGGGGEAHCRDCEPLEQIASVDCGEKHSCALTQSGEVWCWGKNHKGQLGDGTTETRIAPVMVNLANATELAAGVAHTCALTQSGDVWCWGLNDKGQLGDGTTTDSASPVVVPGVMDAVHVTACEAAKGHTCAVTSSGKVYCWGENENGQLGDGSTTDSASPVEVTGLIDAIEVTAGFGHTCAVTQSGAVWCWGLNDDGQLGLGDIDGVTVLAKHLSPVQVPGLGNVMEVTAGWYHTCALLQSGELWCWGLNTQGQLGDGTDVSKTSPTKSDLGDAASTDAYAYGHHTCAVVQGGSVWCWGTGVAGNAPEVMPGLSDVVKVSPGYEHTCALTQSGTLWCWGRNDYGQLGHATTREYTWPAVTPVEVLKCNTLEVCETEEQCIGGACLPPCGCGVNAVECACGSVASPAGAVCSSSDALCDGPVVAVVAKELHDPDVNMTRESNEEVRITLKLSKIPELNFERDELYYVIDMKPTEAELSPQHTWQSDLASSGCRLLWQPALDNWYECVEDPRYMVASITRSYTQLSQDCILDAENVGDGLIEREGVVAIYLVSNHTAATTHWTVARRVDGEYVERTWLSFVTVTFDAKVMNYLYPMEIGDIDLSDRFNKSFHLGGFASSLLLYKTASFITERSDKSYEVGDPVHVRHILENPSVHLDLDVVAVYLSTSPTASGPGDEAAIVHDIFTQIKLHHKHLHSQERFTFIARRCESCFLHVISKVKHTGPSSRRLMGSRRLADGDEVHTMQTVYAEMKPPVSAQWRRAGGPMLSLVLMVRGVDFNGLVASVTLRTRFVAELTGQLMSSLGNGIGEEHCLVTLAPGSVLADVVIRIPSDAQVPAIRAAIEAPSFQSALEDDVTRSLLAIEGMDSVVHGTMSTELVEIELEAAPEDKSAGVGSWELVLMVAAAACLICLITCLFCIYRCARKASARRMQEYGAKAAEHQPAGCARQEVQQSACVVSARV